eukprot:6930049-Alexandrium_andersonii.AAC.1
MTASAPMCSRATKYHDKQRVCSHVKRPVHRASINHAACATEALCSTYNTNCLLEGEQPLPMREHPRNRSD